MAPAGEIIYDTLRELATLKPEDSAVGGSFLDDLAAEHEIFKIIITAVRNALSPPRYGPPPISSSSTNFNSQVPDSICSGRLQTGVFSGTTLSSCLSRRKKGTQRNFQGRVRSPPVIPSSAKDLLFASAPRFPITLNILVGRGFSHDISTATSSGFSR